jgi:hypothetical protein
MVHTGRYYRTGDSCRALIVIRAASIKKKGRRVVWLQERTKHCDGLLLRLVAIA